MEGIYWGAAIGAVIGIPISSWANGYTRGLKHADMASGSDVMNATCGSFTGSVITGAIIGGIVRELMNVIGAPNASEALPKPG